MKRIRQIVMLLICIAVMAVAAIQKNGKLLGQKIGGESKTELTTDSLAGAGAEVLQTEDDGTIVVNTTSLCRDVDGYAGPVPMEIKIQDGKIVDLKALANDETPEFFDEAKVIIAEWRGKTLEEGLQLQVDAVSGATFSSNAIMTNIREGLSYTVAHMPDSDGNGDAFSGMGNMDLSAKSIIGLIVVLMAALIPLFFKSKTFRTIQLLLNVGVLGFWCGTFLNYTMFLRALSNGMDWWVDLIPIIMLITAFVYPLFGKKAYYCTNVCPFGSLQDLAGKLSKKKWKLSKGTLQALNWFRRILWIVLMGLMVSGIYFDWINYEFFTAFIFQAASWVVIVLAIVCTLLSIFIPRPYCRFICPTGSLMKTAEDRF
ncbi:MAG: 4Fe-4S binding protein [Bacteroidaceae bacterium]|nr:4Fe-4S binding protein [Bacteroidaceae bacterium]